MAGPDRAMAYAVMMATGLRKSEAGSLKRSSFDLDGPVPTVMVEAAYSKHRRRDVLSIPGWLVAQLRTWLDDRAGDGPIFQLPDKPVGMLNADLKAAGIATKTAAGVVDIHALRHTFVSRLDQTGATTKGAQDLARHSDPRLTFGVYAHTQLADLAGTVDRLSNPFPKGEAPTGGR